jgi:hypothetical protein
MIDCCPFCDTPLALNIVRRSANRVWVTCCCVRLGHRFALNSSTLEYSVRSTDRTVTVIYFYPYLGNDKMIPPKLQIYIHSYGEKEQLIESDTELDAMEKFVNVCKSIENSMVYL